MNPILLPPDFDLPQTLDCGQAFRWRPVLSETTESLQVWEGAAADRYLKLSQSKDNILLYCSETEFGDFWQDYFDREEDYEGKRRELSRFSPVLQAALEFCPGIRILRQDSFEALCSFLISQNNNIPRIKGIIERFCALLGKPIGETGFFSFPTAEAVAACSVEDLAPIRAGFRAKYLIDAARRVVSGEVDLAAVAKQPVDFGREELQKILGVGPKVAECALLYGFHKTECFPMDVWMKRVMTVLLPEHQIEEFGQNAGLAQQFLFHYSRMNQKQLFSEKN